MSKIKEDIMSIGEGNYKQMRINVKSELSHMSKLTSNICNDSPSKQYQTLLGKNMYKLTTNPHN